MVSPLPLLLPLALPSVTLPSRLRVGLGFQAPLRLWLGLGVGVENPPLAPQSIPPGAGSGGGQEGQRARQGQNQTQAKTSISLVLACASCPYLDRPALL
jgi:hypothetical protein